MYLATSASEFAFPTPLARMTSLPASYNKVNLFLFDTYVFRIKSSLSMLERWSSSFNILSIVCVFKKKILKKKSLKVDTSTSQRKRGTVSSLNATMLMTE